MNGQQVVIGLGCASAATAHEVDTALTMALQVAGCSWPDVVEIATVDSRRGHPALAGLAALAPLAVPVRFYSAALLAGACVPHPSGAVALAVGTASVAEAAALISSGAEELLVPKRCTAHVCTAVAKVGGQR